MRIKYKRTHNVLEKYFYSVDANNNIRYKTNVFGRVTHKSIKPVVTQRISDVDQRANEFFEIVLNCIRTGVVDTKQGLFDTAKSIAQNRNPRNLLIRIIHPVSICEESTIDPRTGKFTKNWRKVRFQLSTHKLKFFLGEHMINFFGNCIPDDSIGVARDPSKTHDLVIRHQVLKKVTGHRHLNPVHSTAQKI